MDGGEKILKNMRYRSERHIYLFVASAARYVVLISFGYMLLYPVLFFISSALKSTADYYDPTVQWVPKSLSFDNFVNALKVLDYGKSVLSTFVNEVVAALIQVVSCMVAAYGLSRFNLKCKKLLTAVMIFTILIPFPMILVPSYVNFQMVDFLGILGGLGKLFNVELRPSLLNTPLVFWLPSLFAVGLKGSLFIYIYSQFFKGLPRELEEAAWIDGAGPLRTFWSIIIPSSGTAIITVLLFSVIWHWNDYYLAQIYLSENYPLGVKITNIYQLFAKVEGLNSLNQGGIIMAACFLMILPMLVFYLFSGGNTRILGSC